MSYAVKKEIQLKLAIVYQTTLPTYPHRPSSCNPGPPDVTVPMGHRKQLMVSLLPEHAVCKQKTDRKFNRAKMIQLLGATLADLLDFRYAGDIGLCA